MMKKPETYMKSTERNILVANKTLDYCHVHFKIWVRTYF